MNLAKRPTARRWALLGAICIASLAVTSGCIEKKRPRAADEEDDGGANDEDTGSGGIDTAGLQAGIILCPIPHTIDGRFTGWPDQTDCSEWDITPMKGVYGDLYVAYQKGRLVILNDWHLRIEDIPKDWYNLFTISTGGGTQQWQIRVYADDKITVLLDGKPYKAHVAGAYGFSASPEHPQPHTIFELELIGVLPGPFTVSESDPGPGKWPTPEKALKKEPKSFVGVLTNNGVQDAKASDTPILVAINPPTGTEGSELIIDGSNLGDELGELYFDTTAVTVTTWSDTVLFTKAPAGVGSFDVFARRADGVDTNTLRYMAKCAPVCDGKTCGDNGCGGVCGTCSGQATCASGTCVCQPACGAGVSKKSCGPDGCGGTCGSCTGTDICINGDCKPKPPDCKPACDGKDCGSDGCGGSCGTCKDGKLCGGGLCKCVPKCEGKNCGPDGCGGVCGNCGGGQACKNGACSCTPGCTGKSCGPDGCGGSCGACSGGQACLAYQCCKPQCTKQEAGKTVALQCGWDGCASSCGTCPKGKYCLAGLCVCEPQCDGKQCGPDGCGGSCGSCPLGQGCKNGACSATSG